MCVPALPYTLAKMNFSISTCLKTDWFLFPQNYFFVLKPNFRIFCRSAPEENVKKYKLQFGIIPTSEFFYLITNHVTDAIA